MSAVHPDNDVLARLWCAWSCGLKLTRETAQDKHAFHREHTPNHSAVMKAWGNELANLPDGTRLVPDDDPTYPQQLLAWEGRPLFLYIQGSIAAAPHVAMVGSRRADAEGLRVAAKLASELAPHAEVVSGGARGIDAACHRGALRTGRTTAVLPSGLDRMSPASNRSLFAKIQDSGGALISEMPLGTTVRKHHFARRNALLVALCQAVVVVRAEVKGGTMLTAGIAKRRGKDLFVVPGSPEDPCALGALALARDGATLAWKGVHVLPQAVAQTTSTPPLSPVASTLLEHLRRRGAPTFSLTDLPQENVFAALMELEMKGVVRGTDQYGVWRISFGPDSD